MRRVAPRTASPVVLHTSSHDAITLSGSCFSLVSCHPKESSLIQLASCNGYFGISWKTCESGLSYRHAPRCGTNALQRIFRSFSLPRDAKQLPMIYTPSDILPSVPYSPALVPTRPRPCDPTALLTVTLLSAMVLLFNRTLRMRDATSIKVETARQR